MLDEDQLATYKKIPQEKIFVHYNAPILFSGDYLYYKLYNINSKTQKLSNISKIAYVELIGKDLNYVFKHKTVLKSGLGQGDFFIPTSIPSGNYKLIAFTKWMKNVSNEYFFQGNICIINPFIKTENSSKEKTFDSISNQISFSNTTIPNKFIGLDINKKRFSKREKVVLKISSLMNKTTYGNYSISVRKIDSLKNLNKPNAITYKNSDLNNSNLELISIKKPVYLPELRGEIFSGVILEKDTKKPAALKKISLSISGENAIFKLSLTNDSGMFYFVLDKPYNAVNANLHIMEDNQENYEIVLNAETEVNYDILVFEDFKINPEMEKLILDRSINNQIENAYSSVKRPEPKVINEVKPFYQGEAVYYNLDDYTRFPSMKETTIEIVKEVYVEKKKGFNYFKIKTNQPTDKNLSTLIIVDGLLVLNHDDLFYYDARKIRSISVVNKKYKYGGDTFSGILSVETIEADFKNIIPSNYYTKRIPLVKTENNKNYFQQTYSGTELEKRIPDYRNQLLWEPNFVLNKEENIITFYTSDYLGDYEINIEGFTNQGFPVSIKEIIKVE